MSLTPAEEAALDALLTEPDDPSMEDSLTALGISHSDYWEAVDAKREFAEYILAAAIQDLYIAGSLTDHQEVVHIARKYWPLKATATEES